MQLIRDLGAAGVHLDVQDGKLVAEVQRGAVTPELDAAIRAHRDELVELLSDPERMAVEYALWLFDGEVVEEPAEATATPSAPAAPAVAQAAEMTEARQVELVGLGGTR